MRGVIWWFVFMLLVWGCGGSGDKDGDGGGAETDSQTGEIDTDIGTDTGVDPCAGVSCPDGQWCIDRDGPVCAAGSCGDLQCPAYQRCEEEDGVAVCADVPCSADADCPVDQYCDSEAAACRSDVCQPGARACDGDAVVACAANGGGNDVVVTCAAGACVARGDGVAGCACAGSWECPGYQRCEGGVCVGSVDPPSCRLPPLPLDQVLPALEIQWGGADETDADAGLRIRDGVEVPFAPSPWPAYGQVVQTPVVANLTDDNGDGKVDDADVPDIAFVAFATSSDVTSDGVLRVISGGGVDAFGASRKGVDLVAVCGPNRFYAGTYFDGEGAEQADLLCDDSLADLDSTATLAVGDLDYDGTPEIVAVAEDSQASGSNDWSKKRGSLHIYDNTGRLLLATEEYTFGNFSNPGPTVANIVPAASGEEEMAEIAVGRDVFVLAKTDDQWSVAAHFAGTGADGDNGQGPVSCVADLLPERPGMEIVAGASVYGVPLVDGAVDLGAAELVLLASDGNRDGFCGIADVWGADGTAPPGPDNPLDGVPEVVVVSGGNLFVYRVTQQAGSVVLETVASGEDDPSLQVPGSTGGGAPNIDDFDGDGFPEVGTAGSTGYVVFDFQPPTAACPAWPDFGDGPETAPRTPPQKPCTAASDCGDPAQFTCHVAPGDDTGTCICLHNGWRRRTQDSSSKVTGSSVFDFNGDGKAEVIYNDECHFRLYDGATGEERFLVPSESRTRIEYPVVADVDNDGNAEIVFSTSNESQFCTSKGVACTTDADCPSGGLPGGQQCINGKCALPDRSVFNNGIEVWGEPLDRWVSARRVWNQHAYHVTNVTESGGIPSVEFANWTPRTPALYNTYRSQPRTMGAAPDLVVENVSLSSPDAACGTLTSTLDISVQIGNIGDLRGGMGVAVVFFGTWDGAEEILRDGTGEVLRYTLTSALSPGQRVYVNARYEAAFNGKEALPDTIAAVVDPPSDLLLPGDDSAPWGVERECREENNRTDRAVDPGSPMPDLQITIDDVQWQCPAPAVTVTVRNTGSETAEDVVVRFVAGAPSLGGEPLMDVNVGDVAAGEAFSKTYAVTAFPVNREIALYAVADPDNRIPECNEADNEDGPTDKWLCIGSIVE